MADLLRTQQMRLNQLRACGAPDQPALTALAPEILALTAGPLAPAEQPMASPLLFFQGSGAKTCSDTSLGFGVWGSKQGHRQGKEPRTEAYGGARQQKQNSRPDGEPLEEAAGVLKAPELRGGIL